MILMFPFQAARKLDPSKLIEQPPGPEKYSSHEIESASLDTVLVTAGRHVTTA